MEFCIVEYWSFAFTVILSLLGGLTYFIQQQFSIDKSQLFSIMNQQKYSASTNSRQRNSRNGIKKKHQTIRNTTSNGNDINGEEDNQTSSETIIEKCDQEENSIPDHSTQQSGERQNHEQSPQCNNGTKEVLPGSSVPTIDEDIQEPMIPVKQRHKAKSTNKPSNSYSNSSKDDHIVPSKPQASVAPVKQPHEPSSNYSNSSQDTHSMSNGYMSPSNHTYKYSSYNSLPPRFQQQKLQKEAASAARRFRRRREPLPQKRSSLSPDSAARANDFIPSSLIENEQSQQQQQQQQQFVNYDQTESSMNIPQQHELTMNNGYSSESDILTDSPSTGGNNSVSPLLSTSVGSQSSLQRLELVRSLTTSHSLLDELVSIFDTIPFSSDELQIILNKIASKNLTDKHDLQRLIMSTKSDKTFERILDETYRSQAKILAIELQAEKGRVLELTKSNADMEHTIRQLQQQQQQPNNMIQYEQMLVTYQIQLRRLADENTRLQHQLHAYSLLPATINELKQQQHMLNEQIRQMTIRNSALENEAAESERASKHAAEIYKKADTQKQERIEQMIADINKYKKLDKELTNLRQKHTDLEKSSSLKVQQVTQQRDELVAHCDQLKQQMQEYEQLQAKYENFIQNQSKNPTNQIKQEINDLKAKNDELRQRNWKIMEELNELLREQQQNQNVKSS